MCLRTEEISGETHLAGTKEAVSVELLAHPLRHQLDPPGYINRHGRQFLGKNYTDLPGPAAVPLSSLDLLSLSSLSGGSTAMPQLEIGLISTPIPQLEQSFQQISCHQSEQSSLKIFSKLGSDPCQSIFRGWSLKRQGLMMI